MITKGARKLNHQCMLPDATNTTVNHLYTLPRAVITTMTEEEENTTKGTLSVTIIVTESTMNKSIQHVPMIVITIVMMIVTTQDVTKSQKVAMKVGVSENLMIVTNIPVVWIHTKLHRDAIIQMKTEETVTIIHDNIDLIHRREMNKTIL